jgi:hypothetical protein
MAQPMPRRAGGLRRWAWLIGAAGLVVVGVIAVGVVVVQNLRGGYYVGEEGGRVVLYKGTPQEVPVISLHSKAAADEQPNPPIMVADLPPSQQRAVRETFSVDGPAALDRLRSQVCWHSLVNEGGKIVVWKGRGQNTCSPATKVKETTIPVAELPESDRTRIDDDKAVFAGLQPADNELRRLETRRNQCKQNRSALPDCPGGRGR